MKIALGTVQFGLTYGAFNAVGKVSYDEASKIIDVARKVGITTIDTANAYGDSEAVLGRLGVCHDFKVVTKVPGLTGAGDTRQVREIFSESLDKLSSCSVYGLLLHRAADLLGSNGDKVWRELVRLQEEGFVKKIGFSAYDAEGAMNVLRRYPAELIQVPLNVFDNRAIESGLLDQCREYGVQIHARSAFLQGFILSNPAKLRGHLAAYGASLISFHDRCRDLELTPLQGAVKYLLQLDQVDQVVVGVDKSEHLTEILNATIGDAVSKDAFYGLAVDDLNLIDPFRWA